jgi:hypothetical protein
MLEIYATVRQREAQKNEISEMRVKATSLVFAGKNRAFACDVYNLH